MLIRPEDSLLTMKQLGVNDEVLRVRLCHTIGCFTVGQAVDLVQTLSMILGEMKKKHVKLPV